MNHAIAEAIRNNDKTAYQSARYPKIQDGEWLIFVNEDFTASDFSQFATGFFAFFRCKLDGVKGLNGQPVLLTECSVQNLDLRDENMILIANDCDLSNLCYDDNTHLVYKTGDHIDAQSSLHNCTLDQSTHTFLQNQGVAVS